MCVCVLSYIVIVTYSFIVRALLRPGRPRARAERAHQEGAHPLRAQGVLYTHMYIYIYCVCVCVVIYSYSYI